MKLTQGQYVQITMLEEYYVNERCASRLVLQDVDLVAYFKNPFHRPHYRIPVHYLEQKGILSSPFINDFTDQTNEEILHIEVAILNSQLRVIQGIQDETN